MSFSDALRGIRDAADDAGQAPPVEPPPSAIDQSRPRPFTVTEACLRVNEALGEIEDGRAFEVEGEVGDCSLRDHWYFTLKDAKGAKLSCAFFGFRRRVDQAAVEPRVGMKMIATGRPELYAKGGRLSFIVTRLRESGVGDLHQRFERLKAQLRDRGWFDPGQRLPLPMFARRILVLTSREAAALRDVEETARRRWPGMEILLAPVPVQGDAATARIAEAVRRARRIAPQLGIDAIVLTRGGGSLEDLWCFNEEAVAAAIHESRSEAVARHRDGGPSPVPLVAAIGHESDTSIAELVADHRASTPTQATMVLVPDASEQIEYLEGRSGRLRMMLQRAVDRAGSRFEVSARHEILRRPDRILEPHRRRLLEASRSLGDSLRRSMDIADRRLERMKAGLAAGSPGGRLAAEASRLGLASERIRRSIQRRIGDEHTRLDHLAEKLRVVGPDSVLARGYALVLDQDGRPVRDAVDLEPGDVLAARFEKGSAVVRVDSASTDEVGSQS